VLMLLPLLLPLLLQELEGRDLNTMSYYSMV
jgi:hypothetical protein